MNRRDFFSDTFKAAAFAALLESSAFPEAVSAAGFEDAPSGAHQQFWNSFFDEVDPTKPHVVMRDAAQLVPAHVHSEKTPRFFHFDEAKGLRYAENIERQELPKLDGAALVSFTISGYHTSDADKKKIGDASLSQLHLHAVQTRPIAQYIAPLAWASLASVFHNNATKLPTVEQLNFVPADQADSTSAASRVLFPKAEGKLAVNVTLPPRDSLLHKMITNGLKVAQIAAPLLSLPAISVPAIKAFTSFYNTLQQNAGFLINSPLTDAVASYDAVDSGNMHADALKLLTGQYIILPNSSTDAFSKQMGDLKLVNGYLVPKSMASTTDPAIAAKNAIPNITYVTLKVSVEQATNEVTAETPKGAHIADPQDPGTSDSPSSPTKGKTTKKS